MLPKKLRLTTVDFKKYRKGKTIPSPHFFLRIARGPSGGPSRAAAVVSSAVERTAAGRNRLRRRIYAILAGQFPAQGGLLFSLHARRGAGALSFHILKKELATLLTTAFSKPFAVPPPAR